MAGGSCLGAVYAICAGTAGVLKSSRLGSGREGPLRHVASQIAICQRGYACASRACSSRFQLHLHALYGCSNSAGNPHATTASTRRPLPIYYIGRQDPCWLPSASGPSPGMRLSMLGRAPVGPTGGAARGRVPPPPLPPLRRRTAAAVQRSWTAPLQPPALLGPTRAGRPHRRQLSRPATVAAATAAGTAPPPQPQLPAGSDPVLAADPAYLSPPELPPSPDAATPGQVSRGLPAHTHTGEHACMHACTAELGGTRAPGQGAVCPFCKSACLPHGLC